MMRTLIARVPNRAISNHIFFVNEGPGRFKIEIRLLIMGGWCLTMVAEDSPQCEEDCDVVVVAVNFWFSSRQRIIIIMAPTESESFFYCWPKILCYFGLWKCFRPFWSGIWICMNLAEEGISCGRVYRSSSQLARSLTKRRLFCFFIRPRARHSVVVLWETKKCFVSQILLQSESIESVDWREPFVHFILLPTRTCIRLGCIMWISQHV